MGRIDTTARGEEIAERLRNGIASLAIPHRQSSLGIVSISVGLLTFKAGDMIDLQALLKQADAAMYDSKHAGRDCVSCRHLAGRPLSSN